MLPDELVLTTLNSQFPCRELQIRQLLSLFSPFLPSPPTLVVHGLDATGKSSIVKAVLEENSISHAIVNSRECITGRHLLERTLVACLDVVEASSEEKLDRKPYARCENISALSTHLQRLFEGREKFTLVFDGIDKQREAPPTLLTALARFGESIPNFSIVMIITVPHPSALHQTGIPHVHFPPYTRDESITILSRNPPPIFLELSDPELEYTDDLAAEDNAWVWGRFLAAVWDSLAKGAARDLVSYRVVCTKLWRPFVAPIVDGTFGTRDFSRLMVHRRTIFQGEDALLSRIVPKSTTVASAASTHDLPCYSKYLLCAAYLASFNPARQDNVYFMKASDKKRRRRKNNTGWTAKNRKISRHLLMPSPFSLDRLLGILRAILPHDLAQTADIYTQIATLSSIRLLVRTGAVGADVLDPGCKWRVNYGFEYVSKLGRSVDFEIGEYLAGGGE
ncbi:uncharacterized protein BDZ99DRAFT_462173 [Mytilinidion resinicola]|uniref:Orc1-like AAA ATPase domain-containing protein n=1 Tax=Mytilinidion resinicola TaxID=574789 RepID=A0A6A6YQR3_9PEZI|nr:uncharacterized protein BDZ99DRAFT_462173 [Mytilinidion resinicola]KAF2810873.1 hypothetical protein BDZ99DRAFT_462173 [Mytilinidion resinicola]